MADTIRLDYTTDAKKSQGCSENHLQHFLNPKWQLAFKNINNCSNTNIYSYLETSVGQSSNLYLKDHFFNTSVNKRSMAA